MKFLNETVSFPEFNDPKSAWLRHGPFAIWLVNALEPRRIVELGTHNGFSYFCFCQAASRLENTADCFAVDTWQGDIHAGVYDESVFKAVESYNRKYWPFSKLLRKNFSEALDDIADNSIDLLHVDGRHYYDDVKTDFESWIPKLSKRAVVLFHDTEVRERGFGVWQYWKEIESSKPSFNFKHQHGLGVLFWGEDLSDSLLNFITLTQDKKTTVVVRDFFETLGELSVDNFVRSEKLNMSASRNTFLENRNTQLEAHVLDIQAASAVQSENLAVQVAYLKNLLVTARNRPFRMLQKKLTYKALTFLGKKAKFLSSRRRDRLLRSAAKRSPFRDDMRASVTSQSMDNYESVLTAWSLQRQRFAKTVQKELQAFPRNPLISIVVPVYNPEPSLLLEMIASVQAQSYSNWEMCIADDCSSDPRIRQVLSEVSTADTRIKIVFRDENGHISEASNTAIDMASGDYIALLDHDDLLDCDALFFVVKEIVNNPDIAILYTDEDKISDSGRRYDPHFKPDWNRLFLYENNYISHFGVYHSELIRKVEGFRKGFEGAQDYDLLLRCIEHIDDHQIRHIPKVLYTWRATPGSTAASSEAKPYATEAGRRAIEEHLERTYPEKVSVVQGPFPFTYKPLWPVYGHPLVSIVIPTRDNLAILKTAVESVLEKTVYDHFEIIIIDNGSQMVETREWLKAIAIRDNRVVVRRDEQPFNYSALNNAAVFASRGEYIVLMNNDVEVISPEWLDEMLALAQRDKAGCIGAKLYYPDDRIQHAGVIIGMGGVAGHGHKHFDRSHPGYFARLKLRQHYTAVTAACLMVSRQVYDSVGGLNETDLPVAFNDVDFCLKVQAAGYENAWTPYAEFYHHESVSRGGEDTPEKKLRFKNECDYMTATWSIADFRDPAYNPNLALNFDDFSYAMPRWD